MSKLGRILLNPIALGLGFFALVALSIQFYIEVKREQCMASCAEQGLVGAYSEPWSGRRRGRSKPGECTCHGDDP